MAFRRWNPSLHPRDARGRFRKKASVGFRVSTRSASVTVGKRYALVPGKINVYGGVLLRVERANNTGGVVDKFLDRGKDRLISSIPEGPFRSIAQGMINEQKYRTGSTIVQASGLRPQRPQLRIARSPNARTSTGRPSARATQTAGTAYNRSPNRKPRRPRQPRARRVA